MVDHYGDLHFLYILQVLDPDELIFYPPHIRTGNEVQSLSQAVTKLSQDMRDYVKGLLAAEKENLGLQAHVSEIRTIAYRDALTKVNNLAAYEKKAEELDWDIRNNIAEFAIVMLDLNKLKAVNDKYGHERGNDYLVGVCGLLCHVFTHSPVYRIGGDGRTDCHDRVVANLAGCASAVCVRAAEACKRSIAPPFPIEAAASMGTLGLAMTNLFAPCFVPTQQRNDTCHCEDPREGGRGNLFSRPNPRPRRSG